MDDELLDDTIEQYLQGLLTAEQAQAFEGQVAADPDLGHRVVVQKAYLLGLEALEQQDLEQRFAQWDLELDAQKSASRAWRWVAVGALAALVAAAFFCWPARPSAPSAPVPIIQDSLPTPPPPVTPKRPPAFDGKTLALQSAPVTAYLLSRQTLGDSNQMAQPLQRAEEAFKASNFEEAERLLSSIPIDGPLRNDVLNRLPFALFYQGKFLEAIPVFNELASADRFEKSRAEWYLLLCYLPSAAQNRAEIKAALKRILSNPDHEFRPQAKKLKKTLERAKML